LAYGEGLLLNHNMVDGMVGVHGREREGSYDKSESKRLEWGQAHIFITNCFLGN
jgi:hypothetical protein